MSAVKMSDYKTAAGYDWEGYRAAQIAAGETCYQCGGWTGLAGLLAEQPQRRLCAACANFSKDEDEVHHPSWVRCPHCGHAQDGADQDLWAEGEHTVTCNQCEQDFQIETRLTYTLISPARGVTRVE